MTVLVTTGAPALAATPRSAPRPAALVEPDIPEADVPAQGRQEREKPRPSPTASPSGLDVSVGIRLLDAPIDRRDDTRAHKYIVDHLKPGTTIKRRVMVENTSEIHRKVSLYAAAADVTAEGFEYAPDRTENELSSWIDVQPREEALAPGEEVEALVTIEVPRKAESGERYAVVWAEVPGTDDGNVRNIGRSGIRVYLSVGPGGEPPSGFDIGPLAGGREKDGTPFVSAEVRNTGQRALDLAGELWLSDGPGGLSVGPVKAEAHTLPLDGSTTVRVLLDRRLPDGPWSAKFALASGWTKRTATGTVTFGAVPAAAAGTEDRTDGAINAGLVTSGLVLALFVLYAYRRRNRLRAPAAAA
ncbi:hypothetical protein D7147_20790 [Micromonospora musae]|uniref:Peptidase n=1 Tax=Micromonospora musae TaxID=1894970 RepID=A0A3A9Y0S0_9ACTN|nr:hypothetical protein [Micromonospora musae]RKN17106.1 hypothetical protein D7147_20790 [Micromonospora musae]RKN31041.1 hypothetical protein D7044_17375 [Micromonospora musae]